MTVQTTLRDPYCVSTIACLAVVVFSLTLGASTVVPAQVQRGQASRDSIPVYFEHQVDDAVEVVTLRPPTYPDSLKKAKIPGEVLATFVVDGSGRIETGSIRLTRLTHPAFGRAVVAALGSARYTPAIRKGERVRQVVQQLFVFAQKQ